MTEEEKKRLLELRHKLNKTKLELQELTTLRKKLHDLTFNTPRKVEDTPSSSPISLITDAMSYNYPTATPNIELLLLENQLAKDYVENLRDTYGTGLEAMTWATMAADAPLLYKGFKDAFRLPLFGRTRTALEGVNNASIRAVGEPRFYTLLAYEDAILAAALPITRASNSSLSLDNAINANYGMKAPYFESNEQFLKSLNEFADKYGYEKVTLNDLQQMATNPNYGSKEAQELILLHNTYLRGLNAGRANTGDREAVEAIFGRPVTDKEFLEYSATHPREGDVLFVSPYENAGIYGAPNISLEGEAVPDAGVAIVERPYLLGTDRTKWFDVGEGDFIMGKGSSSTESIKDFWYSPTIIDTSIPNEVVFTEPARFRGWASYNEPYIEGSVKTSRKRIFRDPPKPFWDLHANGGHLFDGLTEPTQLMNDATRVAGPIYVPELGESKVVTGGTPMGDFGLWVGQMLLNTPRFVPFSLLLEGLGLYLLTNLPTEEELKIINELKHKEAVKRSLELPVARAVLAALQGFNDGIQIGILNNTTPVYTHNLTTSIPKNSNLAYRMIDEFELKDLKLGNPIRSRTVNTSLEIKDYDAAQRAIMGSKSGKISLYKAGLEHGGRKQFAKGQPWVESGGNTVTHGEPRIIGIQGQGLPWVSGRHYHGPQGNGFKVGTLNFEEAPFGSHIDLKTTNGVTDVIPVEMLGSIVYKPYKILGNLIGWSSEPLTKANGGQIKKYSDLSMRERAAIIRTAVRNGYTDLNSIQEAYNNFILT